MTKLCPRGKAAAKRKFKVYPSAYANAYASKICAGKIKDPSGTKRKDFRGPKPVGKVVGGIAVRLGKAGAKYLKSKEGREKVKKVMEGPLPKKTGELLKKFKSAMTKKKGGGMTAGSMSGMGRLQKARMMKKGGDAKVNVSKSEMQVKAGREKAKKVIGKLKSFKNQSKGFLKEMAGFEKGGDAKIKKVIKGLNKASALHKAQAKSLQTVVGKSVGGMADYYKDLM